MTVYMVVIEGYAYRSDEELGKAFWLEEEAVSKACEMTLDPTDPRSYRTVPVKIK